MQHCKILDNLCTCAFANLFELYLVANPKNLFISYKCSFYLKLLVKALPLVGVLGLIVDVIIPVSCSFKSTDLV